MCTPYSDQPQKRSLIVNLVGFGLILYGFCTVLYTAWDLDVTHDEGHYVALGLDYLRGDMTKQNVDTGPFSRWFGATAPNLAGLAWAESEVRDDAKPLLVAQTVFVTLFIDLPVHPTQLVWECVEFTA